MYYLYPGATLTLHACTVSEPSDFYVIRGERNFNAWKDNPKGRFWEEHLHISKTCPDMMVKSLNFASRANEYYFAFYNGGNKPSTVRATLYFERPEYITAEGSIVKMCEAGGVDSSTCTMKVPLGLSLGNYHMLLVMEYPSDGNWTTKVKVDWSCNLRTWTSVLVIVIWSLTWLLIFVCCIIALCSCCSRWDYWQHRRMYKQLK